MPTETEVTASEQKTRAPFGRRARKAVAVLASAAAFGGGAVAAPAAHAEHAPPRYPEAAALRDPHELPGLKIHLGRETLNKIKISTLELVSRPKDTSSGIGQGDFLPSCTVVKVAIEGYAEPDVMMVAAHCLGELTGAPFGVLTDPANPQTQTESFNSPYTEYAIADPQDTNLSDRMANPIARVVNISIDTNNKDTALLKVEPLPVAQNALPRVRQFGEIPAIPLNVAAERPVQGTPVALYGEPQANNFEPVAGTGIYLGRVWYSSHTNWDPNSPIIYRQLDLVGLTLPNAMDAENDNCNYATSGSMALLPNGTMLGNLSIRSNKGYGPARIMQPADKINFDNYWRPKWQDELNVDMSPFTTICGFTVMDSHTPLQLVEGFKHPAPSLTGKGGDPNALGIVGKGNDLSGLKP